MLFFFLKTSKHKRIQTFFFTIKLHFSSCSSPRPSWGSNCLLLCRASRHFWHCYHRSSPRRTTPRVAVYHFDKLHYSSDTILSRPQTVPSALKPNLGDALVFFPTSRRQKILLSFERERSGWTKADTCEHTSKEHTLGSSGFSEVATRSDHLNRIAAAAG